MFQKIVLKMFIIVSLSFLLVGCSLLSKTKPKENTTERKEPVATAMPVEVAPAPKSPHQNSKSKPLYQIYYGTNRKPKDANDHSKGYSNKRDHQLHTGTCKVYIPSSHKVGEIKGSLWDKIIHLDLKYGDIQLKSIQNYKDTEELWATLRTLFGSLDTEKEALIFIHGYNNSFKDAAIRAAQIGYDLGIKGVTAFYSWPSANSVFQYSSDEATIQASEKYIKEFIRGFAQKSGASKVHIIAHSMGNRGLLRAINDIQKETPEVRFGQIILAAPDVDADLFQELSKAYTQLADRTTLYVSPKDKAVWMSEIKHDNPRAGVVYPVSIIKDIDTILVDFDFNLFTLSHSYFAEEQKILKDMYNLLNNNTSPKHRPRIQEKLKNKQEYWSLELD